ncbi:hypothetical protein GN956_G13882 [Arapaima gigas]
MGQHFPVRIVPGSLLKFTDAVTIWGRVGFRKDIPCLQEYESRTHFRSGSAQPGYSPAVTVRNAARQTRYGLNKTTTKCPDELRAERRRSQVASTDAGVSLREPSSDSRRV